MFRSKWIKAGLIGLGGIFALAGGELRHNVFPVEKIEPTGLEKGTWAIRQGVEPIDLHLAGKKSWLDETLEDIGIRAGIGRFINHDYLEIGVIDSEGNFQTHKRIQGLGLELKDGEYEMTGGGRLVGLTIDGKYNTFTEDDLIQRDDPHDTLPRQLQHAADKGRTNIAFSGTEAEVLKLYGTLLAANIQINNVDSSFGLLFGPNGNTHHSEMLEVLEVAASNYGLSDRLKIVDLKGWSLGYDQQHYNVQNVSASMTFPDNLEKLRQQIDRLEELSAGQWEEIQKHGVSVNLKTTLPTSTP